MMTRSNKNIQDIIPRPVALFTIYENESVVSEQYRTLRSNIKFAFTNHNLKTLMVTSSEPGEGKSTTAANLAVVFAESGSKTLLIDADMRKPTVGITFNIRNKNGFSNLLKNTKCNLKDSIKPSRINNLDILTSGRRPGNPADILLSSRLSDLLIELKEIYDIIIFDTPPVLYVTDAQIISSQVDGSIIVVREEYTKKQALIRAKGLLNQAGANILGVVYNGVNQKSKDYYG